MKQKLLLLLVLVGILFLPVSVYAKQKEYNTMDLKETLAAEDIKEEFKSYKPNKDAITIYMFRGNGCGYCRAFLTFLNSITDEYGKYFILKSYEVWNDQDNGNLMTEVSTFLGAQATGVPYIVIGDKTFAGYSSDYDEDIKTAIMDLYKTKPKKRYDVMKKMKKGISMDLSGNGLVVILATIVVATAVIMSYINLKFKELYVKLNIPEEKKSLVEKVSEVKKEVVPKKVETKKETETKAKAPKKDKK